MRSRALPLLSCSFSRCWKKGSMGQTPPRGNCLTQLLVSFRQRSIGSFRPLLQVIIERDPVFIMPVQVSALCDQVERGVPAAFGYNEIDHGRQSLAPPPP